MKTRLELHLSLDQGREVDCARFLLGELKPATWAVLAALAAEIVQLHEAQTFGAARVLVVTEAEARDLLKNPPAAVPE